MIAVACEVILYRQPEGQRGGGWCVTVSPDPGGGAALGGSCPEYQEAALYASRLARARGWILIRRGETQIAHADQNRRNRT